MDQPPQSNKQSMDMERAESPQVIAQMQVNNNTQYMAAGPSRTPIILAYECQIPSNQKMRKKLHRRSVKIKTIGFIDLTLDEDEEPPTKKDKLENVAQVNLQQAVSNSKQGTTPSITTTEIVSASPSSSSSLTTEAS